MAFFHVVVVVVVPCQRGLAGYPLVLSSSCSVNQSELISCCHHMIIYVNVHFCFVSAKLQTDLKNCSVKKTSPELQPPPTSPPTKKQRTSLFGHYYRVNITSSSEDAEEVNRVVDERIEGSLTEYESIDSVAVEDGTCYPTECLNTLPRSGMPPHLLQLKVGSPTIILRNLNADDGLCNSTRLICRAFKTHVIEAQIVSGAFAGRRVFIPRTELTPSDSGLPLTLRRRQFPIRLCYCTTINKAQWQTPECVGLHLPTPAFSHGQLYVGLSRAGSADRIFVYAPSKPGRSTDVDSVLTRNISTLKFSVLPEECHRRRRKVRKSSEWAALASIAKTMTQTMKKSVAENADDQELELTTLNTPKSVAVASASSASDQGPDLRKIFYDLS